MPIRITCPNNPKHNKFVVRLHDPFLVVNNEGTIINKDNKRVFLCPSCRLINGISTEARVEVE